MKELFGIEELTNDIELRIGKLKYESILLNKVDSLNQKYSGMAIDKNGIIRNWDLPINMTVPNNYQIIESKNGTMNFISDIDENSWTIISSLLPLENPTSYGNIFINEAIFFKIHHRSTFRNFNKYIH